MRYAVILESEEEGDFHIWCPALKGCHSQGDTKEEALDNIRAAIAVGASPLSPPQIPRGPSRK